MSLRNHVFSRSDVDSSAMGDAQPNTVPFSPRLTSYNGRQYLTYWHDDGSLVVAARNLPNGDWTRNETDVAIGRRDGHWGPGLGIGPEGHVFIAYNTRNSPIRWRKSAAPEEVTSFGPEHVGMTGQNESSATYPEFTRLRDGSLVFGYRQGKSGDGDWMLNRWDPRSQSWQVLQHPLLAGEGERNAYPWNLILSDDGTLHYFWCWRETGDVDTNHDLSYARSTDGGSTWERSDGTNYSLPITERSAEVVDPVDQNSGLINAGWGAFDPSNDAPHVAYYRDDPEGNTQVYHAFLDGGSWVVEAATNRDTSADLGGPGTVFSPLSRMGIVVNDDGTVHILARDFHVGGWPMLLEKVDGTWNANVLYRRNLVHSDVHIDPERWRADRVLSFVDQATAVRGEPWNGPSLLGITDVALEGTSFAEQQSSGDAQHHFVPFASSSTSNGPLTTTNTSFTDTSNTVPFSETTVPGTPVFARLTVRMNAGSDAATASARIEIRDDEGPGGETVSEPVEVTGTSAGLRSTDWVRVPDGFRAGLATVQIKSSDSSAETRVTADRLQLAYRNPIVTLAEYTA